MNFPTVRTFLYALFIFKQNIHFETMSELRFEDVGHVADARYFYDSTCCGYSCRQGGGRTICSEKCAHRDILVVGLQVRGFRVPID
jgi:hypothetical protein